MKEFDPKNRVIEDLKKEVAKYKESAEFYKKMFHDQVEQSINFSKALSGRTI